jgi:hypothetical protein
MMRQAIGHTKLKRLCRRLDIPLWQGVGLLESIWHLTARETPRGDIGKLSDEDIALAIDYRGDEEKLIDALVASGWLDRDPVERLVIHDHADHCDDAVHMRVARSREFFVGGRVPKLSRLPSKERDAAHEYYGSCAPEPAHEPAIRVHGVNTACAQNSDSCVPPEPEPVTRAGNQEPEPVPVPPRAPVQSIRSRERIVSGAISPETWDAFRSNYEESGKPLGEVDWSKAGFEVATLDLTEEDMVERVIPALMAELPGWADREVAMIPYPANWLKTQPWTRRAKPREAPLTKEQRRQREIDSEWEAIGNGTR